MGLTSRSNVCISKSREMEHSNCHCMTWQCLSTFGETQTLLQTKSTGSKSWNKAIESFIRNSFQIIFHSNDAELAPKLAIDTLEDIKMMHQLGYANVEAHNATILLLMLMLEVGRVSRYYWRSWKGWSNQLALLAKHRIASTQALEFRKLLYMSFEEHGDAMIKKPDLFM